MTSILGGPRPSSRVAQAEPVVPHVVSGRGDGWVASPPASNLAEAWEALKARRRLAVSLVDDQLIVDLNDLDDSWLHTDSVGGLGANPEGDPK